MDSQNVVALAVASIAASASLLVALFTRFNQKAIEAVKNDLAEQKSEKDARRDYQYNARQRLYEECEPLLFQLREASESVLRRIRSLARAARNGQLGGGSQSWWRDPYYAASTYYRLLLPLAVFKLIQRRLTLVDLSVDQYVKARYELAKCLYLSFSDDFEFARATPSIEYDPLVSDWAEKRKESPRRYWRQGIVQGELDIAVQALLVDDPKGAPHYMSYGEFEQAYQSDPSQVREAFQVVTDIFCDFHPKTRPVLWRILIAQAHVYEALMKTDQAESGAEWPPRAIPTDNRTDFDWRAPGEEATDEEVLVHPFDVAQTYFQDHLGSGARGLIA